MRLTTGKGTTRARALAMALAVVWSATLVASIAWAEGLGAFHGKIVASETPFGAFATDADLVKALKTQGTTTVRKAADSWPFHFIAFLTRAPGDATVHLVFYDVTQGKREYVNVYDFTIKPDTTSVSGDLSLTDSDGFVAGHRYEAAVTRLIDGKETVYARATVTLK